MRTRTYRRPKRQIVLIKNNSSGRARRMKRRMKGGFLPLLIPLIAAAIGAAPAIAGTIIAAKNSKQ
ncbi:pX protein [Barthadenovirus sternae]|uniref:PX n=1 Tax=Tern adenovirus TaxID=2820437 RepID=A0A8K1KWD2_9ADEN|nr:pX [Tern adenovirus]UJZ92510.1 pX protein [Tern atadenovirus 1]